MHTIAVVATKGGVGKTTLATCLAVELAKTAQVALLDLDPQQSLADWWGRRGEPDNPRLYSGIEVVSEAVHLVQILGPDWLIVDTGPGLLHAVKPAVDAADLVIIPIKSSALDLIAIQPALDIAAESGTPYLMVLNECVSTKMDTTATELLSGADHPVASTPIKQRVAYRSAATTGKTGAELDDKAAAEITALLQEIQTIIGGKRRG
jgi:chromosome partitioning protein